MTKTPNVLWAQRPGAVFVTIDVQDVKGESFWRDDHREWERGKLGRWLERGRV